VKLGWEDIETGKVEVEVVRDTAVTMKPAVRREVVIGVPKLPVA